MTRTILLEGEPAEMGRCYGELAAPFIRDRIRRMWEIVDASPWGTSELDERGERFRSFLDQIAPEWLDEAEAMAAAAGVNPTDLFVLNALPRGFWESSTGGCTSVLVVGNRSATHDTLLHKNRDLHNEVQTFHVSRAPSGAQLFASRDIGNLGFGHFHSDRALAGANNTGSYIPLDELRECGLACAHLLRLVAERASSCDEAVAVLEDAIARELAGASGGSRGMIFLLAEPSKGVVVEMTSRRLAYREVRDEAIIRSNHFLLDEMRPYAAEPPNENTLRRCRRAHELLDPTPAISVADLQRLSRDHNDGPDSICSDDSQHFWMTISACTHVVRADNADPLAHTRAMMGNPRNTLAIPIPRAIDGLPAACVDGTLHNLSRQLYAAHGVGEHLAETQQEHERAMVREFASAGAAARFGPPERLRPQLTELVARCVERVRSLLEEMIA